MSSDINSNRIYKSLIEIPAQIDKNSDNIPRIRARYFNSGNAFMIGQSEIPDFVFEAEPKKAFSDTTPTCLIPCDISGQLRCDYPTTSPLILV